MSTLVIFIRLHWSSKLNFINLKILLNNIKISFVLQRPTKFIIQKNMHNLFVLFQYSTFSERL